MIQDLIEALPTAVGLVASGGAVVRANRRFREWSGCSGPGWRRVLADHASLQNDVQACLRDGHERLGWLADETALPYRLVPLASRRRDIDEPLLMLMIGDRYNVTPTQVAALQRGCGLTPAEARVAMLLADGLEPAVIAQSLAVSPNTVRSQLTSIRGKMAVHSQAAIVAQVARLWRVTG